jgi:hypothetical protein
VSAPRKPSAAQLFCLARAVRHGGAIGWKDRGPAGYGITDATVRACCAAGWGRAAWGGGGWIRFDVSEQGKAVSADEVKRQVDAEQAAQNRIIASEDEATPASREAARRAR